MANIVLLTPPSHTHRTAEENIGIGYLASCLRETGHLVTIIDGWLLGLSVTDIVDRCLATGNPDLIGISCYRYSLGDVQKIIRLIRERGCIGYMVVGGYGPTYHDEDFLRIGADYVVRGEAEQVMVTLANALEEKGIHPTDIAGLSWLDPDGLVQRSGKLSGVSDLDALPFPSRDTIAATLELKNPVHLVTSRGCMANCLFCSVVSFGRRMTATKRWRQRSLEDVIDEIRELYERFGVTHFKIVDDSFIEPPRDVAWAEAFAEALDRHQLRIRFRTQVRADRLSEPLVRALAYAGWFATSVGIENGSPTALHRMNKSATLEDNLQALSLLERYGVYVQMGMILFDHETSLEELQENLSFLQRCPWVVTKGVFTEMYAAEGTPFTTMLKRRGRIITDTGGNYTYAHADARVAAVYQALKQWHRSHSVIYDHALNPIGAPKALPLEGYEQYHVLCRNLYDTDVAFFALVMQLIGTGVLPEDIPEYTEKAIANAETYFGNIAEQLIVLDGTYGLAYDAAPNPFLKAVQGVTHVT